MSPTPPAQSRWDLGNGYQISLFDHQEDVTSEQVWELWTSEAGVRQAEARRRLSEVFMIATGPSGELAAILTVYLARNEQLRAQVWHMRAFTAQAHRRARLAEVLTVLAANRLEEMFQSGEERRAIGIVGVIENPVLKGSEETEFSRRLGEALWPNRGAVFINQDARGRHIRVDYFEGALAPEPEE